MTWLSENWGDLASGVGLVISLGGLTWAIIKSTQAAESAKLAEDAAKESAARIGQMITSVEMERVSAAFQRLKDLQRDGKWEVALEGYHPLRIMLSDIGARHPSPNEQIATTLQSAIAQVKVIEDSIDDAVRNDTQPKGSRAFNPTLNSIQNEIELIASGLQTFATFRE